MLGKFEFEHDQPILKRPLSVPVCRGGFGFSYRHEAHRNGLNPLFDISRELHGVTFPRRKARTLSAARRFESHRLLLCSVEPFTDSCNVRSIREIVSDGALSSSSQSVESDFRNLCQPFTAAFQKALTGEQIHQAQDYICNGSY
jgi:hypothetical protein